MGGSYSCPAGYQMLRQDVYKDTVRLCLEKQMIQNKSVITDISVPVWSSSATSIQFPWHAVIWLFCTLLSLLLNV